MSDPTKDKIKIAVEQEVEFDPSLREFSAFVGEPAVTDADGNVTHKAVPAVFVIVNCERDENGRSIEGRTVAHRFEGEAAALYIAMTREAKVDASTPDKAAAKLGIPDGMVLNDVANYQLEQKRLAEAANND